MGRPPFAVLGLGNELFTDEGLGVEAARRVEALQLPGVETLDGGTLGLALLPELEGRTGVLVLDAIAGEGLQPGAVVELGRQELLQPRRLLMSAHQIGVSETLAAASLMGVAPHLLGAIGMVPFSLETGYGLTPEAEARLPTLVALAAGRLTGWSKEVWVHA